MPNLEISAHSLIFIFAVAEVREGSGYDTSEASLDALIKTVREKIALDHGVGLSTVVILKIRTIAKTTSGKIARSWCKKAFLEGKLQVLRRWDGVPSVGGKAVQADDGINDANMQYGMDDDEIEVRQRLNQSHAVPRISVDELRGMPIEEITANIEKLLVSVAGSGSAPIEPPVDSEVPLNALGLDSMTIIQLKGILEKRFYLNVPDAFLFTEMCTLTSLATAAKTGSLTEHELAALKALEGNGGGEGGERTIAPIVEKKKGPFCPWWTCCY